ncbi:CHAT domain-containing protein [Nocardia amikacinitolerans]|uniref:CHAT domain-containing protein n=1 Tax=Nocardia amikacinitolerans TaxID=756689 RepID=A0A285LSS0_9NOCA|nr:CHAT domain-containing protein [Nocardia amikacinitolerans]SNY87493.1 CHAT domain-containing protein [Nocardia amikacinitolerans]
MSEHAPSEQPTVVVRMADAGDLYISWRWDDDLAPRGAAMLPGDPIEAAVRALADALPNPNVPGGLERALTTGAFASPDAEYALAQSLSRALLPHGLAVQLHDLYTRGIRPHIRLQPSPRVAQVPWEIIAPDPDLRLVDFADVSLLAPAGVVQAPDRRARSWAADRELPVVAVLDPRVPGFRADSALGSVLGRMDGTGPLAERVAELIAGQRLRPAVADPVEVFRRTDLDRTWLSETLRAGASRLIYVGHVTAAAPESGQSENAELHLTCTADTTGFAEPLRAHRPLSAKDLLLGTHTLAPEPIAGPDLWPIPSRVALIACESGGDLRFTEALGLIAAMINGGAELVTATRWPLPTDLAFQRLASATTATPLQDLIHSIDTAHDHPTPLLPLTAWHRTRLTTWRETGAIEHSPLLWSAIATFHT